MSTKSVMSRCQRNWVAHGWDECPGCKTIIKKDGAKFSLSGTPGPHLLLDMDKIPCLQNKRRCDFLFIAEEQQASNEWIVPIECTSGDRKEEKTVLQQLRAGAEFIERNIPNSANLLFQPILVGKVSRAGKNRKDKKMTVQFHDKLFLLGVVRSGGAIASKLKA